MLTSNIGFKNFNLKKNSNKIKSNLKIFFKENNQILKSLGKDYKNSFDKSSISKYKKNNNFRIIGMGGSILGTRSIYDFLKHKIKKNFDFVDNINPYLNTHKEKNYVNIIVSKSGNTLETISNVNILIKKDKNIFITENRKSYLLLLAQKLKAEIIHHNNFIGGRYSVLSEVGMLPAELMNLNIKNFKQINYLIKNKKFINSLTQNVANTLFFLKNKKFNSVILNYDKKSDSLFKWYQQLIAESLGKENLGIFPVISTMPKDNHSLMQYYLDGTKNNFFTFFYVHNQKSSKIKNNELLFNFNNIKNKSLDQISISQKIATENVFRKKNIPFRSFEIFKRDEKTLGELFCFFILETILLGRSLKINPYDQPAVDLIKKETKKILV